MLWPLRSATSTPRRLSNFRARADESCYLRCARTLLIVCSAIAFGSDGRTCAVPRPQNRAEVSFQFDRTGLPVPRFTLRIHEDGTGSYQADQAESAGHGKLDARSGRPAYRPSHQPDSGDVAKIFKAARAVELLQYRMCVEGEEYREHGQEDAELHGADGSGSCTYNYSENKTVDTLTDTFLAIAFTMDEGRRLEFLHRYDRLGLDAEMISLAQEAEAGRALELGTIAPTLAAIADDTAVIQRVRLRAQKMLEQVAAENH